MKYIKNIIKFFKSNVVGGTTYLLFSILCYFAGWTHIATGFLFIVLYLNKNYFQNLFNDVPEIADDSDMDPRKPKTDKIVATRKRYY